MARVALEADSGDFALAGNFNVCEWNIRIISEINSEKGKQRKQLDYKINAR